MSDFVPVLLFYTLEGLHILVFGWILFKRFFSLLFTREVLFVLGNFMICIFFPFLFLC